MGYTGLLSKLEQIELKNFITNMIACGDDLPYLMLESLKMLSDESTMFNIIKDSNKVALCNMIRDYFFSDCYVDYMNNVDYSKIIEYGKLIMYKVYAEDGLRNATVNEISQGVHNLTGEEVYQVEEKEYKLLCLLQWTLTGKSYIFRKAGYKLEYDDNGKPKTLFYDMVVMCANEIKELFSWVHSDGFEVCVKRLKKLAKSRGYKYATYAKDEIIEDIPIKQLFINIKERFPRRSDDKDYRKALAIVLKTNIKYAAPLDIAFLRNVYERFTIEQRGLNARQIEQISGLKQDCERLLKEQFSGKIKSDHYAYRIISTLKSTGYSRCSPKQLKIIEDAKRIIQRYDEAEEIDNDVLDRKGKAGNETRVISEDEIDISLAALSNAMGDGLFED